MFTIIVPRYLFVIRDEVSTKTEKLKKLEEIVKMKELKDEEAVKMEESKHEEAGKKMKEPKKSLPT